MNKIVTEYYNITSPYLSNNIKMAFLSDIHGDIVKLEAIVELLKKLQISAVLLGGDLINSNNDYYRNVKIMELLQEIAKTMNIFIGIGNHDMLLFEYNSQKICSNLNIRNYKFWSLLSESNNIHVSYLPIGEATFTKWSLNNSVDISALNLPLDYYLHKEPCVEFRKLLEYIETIDINTSKFNILLCHSPKNVVRRGIIGEYSSYLKQFNLILSGHMHAGLVPMFLRNSGYGGGIVGPHAAIFPKHAYGLVIDNNIASLTTGGVTKTSFLMKFGILSNNILIQNMNDSLYPSEIEIFNFMQGEEETINKVKKYSK